MQDIVLVGYNDSGSFVDNPPTKFTGWARSTDGGQSFTDLGHLPGPPPPTDIGDPVLAHDDFSNRVYFATLGGNQGVSPPAIDIFTSNDSGLTFTGPGPVNAFPGAFGFDVDDFIDKPWMAVDNFGGIGIGQQNVYVIARNFAGVSGPSATTPGIYLSRSLNGGASFVTGNGGTPIVTEPAGGNVQGPFVTVAPDHSVDVYWFEESPTGGSASLRHRRSTDQGVTFGPTNVINPALVVSPSGSPNGDLGLAPGFRTNKFLHADVNPVTGALYVTYANAAGADAGDIFLQQSTDGGATWSAPVRVNNDATTNDQWQPTLKVSEDGTTMFVGFYDRRRDPANTMIDAFGAVATVDLFTNTVTVGENFRITDTSFAPVFGSDGAVNPTYMGDYDTADFANGKFYYSWADNRFGTPDVFTTSFSQDALLAIDTTPPATPAMPDMLDGSDSGMDNTDNVTNKMTPTFRGTGEADATVRIFRQSKDDQGQPVGPIEQIGSGVVGTDSTDGIVGNGLGQWQIQVNQLVDGNYNITVELEDAAGNISAMSQPLMITIDTAAPNTPLLDLLTQDDTLDNNMDKITAHNMPRVSMTTTDPFASILFSDNLKFRIFDRYESTAEFKIYDSALDMDVFNISDPADMFTSLTLIVEQLPMQYFDMNGADVPAIFDLGGAGGLADGTHHLKLEVEDRAGNISEDFLLPIKIDTDFPLEVVDLGYVIHTQVPQPPTPVLPPHSGMGDDPPVIEPDNPEDWYKVTSWADGTFEFVVTALSGSVTADVYDTLGNLVSEDVTGSDMMAMFDVPVVKGQMLYLHIKDDPLTPGKTSTYTVDIVSNDKHEENNSPQQFTDLGMVVHHQETELTVPWGDEDWFKFTTWAQEGDVSIWMDLVDRDMDMLLDPDETLVMELWKDTGGGPKGVPDGMIDTSVDTLVTVGRVDRANFSVHIDNYPAEKNEMFWLRVAGDPVAMSINEYDLDIVNDDVFDRERSGLWVVDSITTPLSGQLIGNIFEIDPDTGAVLRTLPVPEPVSGFDKGLGVDVRRDATGKFLDVDYLYFINGDGGINPANEETVYTLDPRKGAIVNAWGSPIGSDIDALAVDSENGILYLADFNANRIYRQSIANPPFGTGAVLGSVVVAADITGGLAFNATTGKLLATLASDEIATIDPATGAVESTIPGAGVSQLGVASLGNRLFTADKFSKTITELNPANGTVLNSFRSPDGSLLFTDGPSAADGASEDLNVNRNDDAANATDFHMKIHVQEEELTLPWGDEDWYKVTTWADDGTVDVRVTLVDRNDNWFIDPEELVRVELWTDTDGDMQPDTVVATAKRQGFDLVIAHQPVDKNEMIWVRVVGEKTPGPHDDTVLVVERDNAITVDELKDWGPGFQPGGRLLRLNQDGKVIQVIDPGNPQDLLNKNARAVFDEGVISDVEIGPNGDIFVAMDVVTVINGEIFDHIGQQGQLVHFDVDGNYLGVIPFTQLDGTPLLDNNPDFPNTLNAFFFTFGFDVANDGTFWVAMPNSNQVAHLDAMGKLMKDDMGNPRLYPVMMVPEEVGVYPGDNVDDPSDDIVLIGYRNTKDGGSAKVDQLDPVTGDLTTILGAPAGTQEIQGAFGINFNMEGEFWLSDHLNSFISQHSAAGNLLGFLDPTDRPIDPEQDWKDNVWSTYWNTTTRTEGVLDATFDVDGLVTKDFGGNDAANGVAIQPDGKIVTVGVSDGDFAVARFLADGLPDTTFAMNGMVTTDFGATDTANAVVIQPDGKILAAGSSGGNFAVVRYNPNGILDSSFGTLGMTTIDFGGVDVAHSVALQPDGKILLFGGNGSDLAIARLNVNGSLDTSFDVDGRVTVDIGGTDVAQGGAVQQDGNIVVAGTTDAMSDDDFVVVRLRSDGTVDPNFGTGGVVVTDLSGNDSAADMAIQLDGKIVVAGTTDRDGDFDFVVVRYNTDGSLDDGTVTDLTPGDMFGQDGTVTTDLGGDDVATALAIQPDWRIIVVGTTDAIDDDDFATVRYNQDGSVDNGSAKDTTPGDMFGTGGPVITDFGGDDDGRAVAIQPNGAVVVVGGTDVNGDDDFALARYYGHNDIRGVDKFDANGDLEFSLDFRDPIFGGFPVGLAIASHTIMGYNEYTLSISNNDRLEHNDFFPGLPTTSSLQGIFTNVVDGGTPSAGNFPVNVSNNPLEHQVTMQAAVNPTNTDNVVVATTSILESVKINFPALGGGAVSDQDMVVIDDGINPAVTFEFDDATSGMGDGVMMGNVAVEFTKTDSPNELVFALAGAIFDQIEAGNLTGLVISPMLGTDMLVIDGLSNDPVLPDPFSFDSLMKSWVDVHFTKDGGHTWMRTRIDDTHDAALLAGVMSMANPVDREDPDVVFDRWGNAYVSYRMTDTDGFDWIIVLRSADGGMMFDEAVVVATGFDLKNPEDPARIKYDNPRLAVGPDFNDPTQDNVYVSYTRIDLGPTTAMSDDTSQIFVWGSHAHTEAGGTLPLGTNALTLVVSDDPAAQPDFSDLAVGPDASVQVTWVLNAQGNDIRYMPGDIMFDVDPDGRNTGGGDAPFSFDELVVRGATATTAGPFPGFMPITQQPKRGVTSRPSIDIDRTGIEPADGGFNGRTYIVFTQQKVNGEKDVVGVYADDANNPLPTPPGVGPNWMPMWMDMSTMFSGDQFLPQVAVDQVTGKVHVAALSDNITGVGGSGVISVTATSPDGGVTFGNLFTLNHAVSSQAGNKPPMADFGDYLGVAAYGGWSFYAWPDNSVHMPDMEVFFNAIHQPTHLPLDPQMPELVMAEWIDELTVPWFDEDWYKFQIGDLPWPDLNTLKVVLDLEDVDKDGILDDNEKLVVELYYDADHVDDPKDPTDFQLVAPKQFFYLGDEPGDPLIDNGQFRLKAFFDISSLAVNGSFDDHFYLRVWGGPILLSSLPSGASGQDDLQSVIAGNQDAVMGSNEYDLHVIPVFEFEPDSLEDNDNLKHAHEFGPQIKISEEGLTIHEDAPSVTNPDYFKITAEETGKLIIDLTFIDNAKIGMGNLDLEVLKLQLDGNGMPIMVPINLTPEEIAANPSVCGLGRSGCVPGDFVADVMASANSTTDNEHLVIPVVSGGMYFLHVFSVTDPMTGHQFQNQYNLNIDNVPAPVPTFVSLDPIDPSSPNGGTTSDSTPPLIALADLTAFESMGILLDQKIGFRLSFDGTGTGGVNQPIMRLTNTSDTAEITDLTLTIGDTSYNFDVVTGEILPVGVTASLITPSDTNPNEDRSDRLDYNFTGFGPGLTFEARPDLDVDSVASNDDYRTVLFNNGAADNAVASVRFSNGAILNLQLSDGGETDDSHTFMNMGTPGADVEIMLQNTADPSVMVRGDATRDGNSMQWRFTVPGNEALPVGLYTVTAKVVIEDLCGNTDTTQPSSPPYLLQVIPSTGVGTISGIVFDDLNDNGDRDSIVPAPDFVFVVDNSNSTIAANSAPGVSDQNSDGLSNTILDAEIAGYDGLLMELSDLITAGTLSQGTTVTVIAFASDAITLANRVALTPAGITQVENALTSITAVMFGATNYNAALQATITSFNGPPVIPQGEGFMIFLSDGLNTAASSTLAAVMQSVATLNASNHTLRAFGVGPNAILDPTQPTVPGLIDIDPNAQQFTNPADLVSFLQNDLPMTFIEPGIPNVTVFIDENGNGVLDAGTELFVDQTDSNGMYMLDLVPTGDHTVRAIRPPGATDTTPPGNVEQVFVGPSEDKQDVDFRFLVSGAATVQTTASDEEVRLSVEYLALDGSPLVNNTVDVGEQFMVAIRVEDANGDEGIVGLTVDLNWQSGILNEVDADFSNNLSSIITTDFPVSQSGSLDQSAGAVDELGGGASPGVGFGSAIGDGSIDVFALLSFEAVATGGAGLQLDLGDVGAILADNSITRNVSIDVPALTVVSGSIAMTDTSGDPSDAQIRFGTPLSQYRTDSMGNPFPDSFLVRPAFPDDRQTFEITNNGSSPLTLSELIVNAPDVTVTPQLGATADDDIVLQPGASMAFQVRYAPSSAGQSFDLADGIEVLTDRAVMRIALQGDSTFNSDVNYDGTVNFPDFSILNGRREGARQGDVDYDPTSDFNGDGVYNLLDLPVFNAEFGLSLKGQPLQATFEATSGSSAPSPLSAADIESTLDAAIDLLRVASPGQDTSVLDAATVLVRDLEGPQLGEAVGTVIWIDVDAAGHGWFVDATPYDSDEFDASGQAQAAGATGRVDLLTVVTHELGHLLGWGDLDVLRHPNDLMTDTLPPGVRRVPVAPAIAPESLPADFDDFADSIIENHNTNHEDADAVDLFFAEFGIID